MGVDLYLIKDDKIVADLGRAHNYKKHNKNHRIRFTHDILGYLCYQPSDKDELNDIIETFMDKMIS